MDFCSICTLPIPLHVHENSYFKDCCMKLICFGCAIAAGKRGMFDCPFCRTPDSDNDADRLAMIQTRVEKKDPEAICTLGRQYYFGSLGLKKDMQKAIDLYIEALGLGSIEAFYNLGVIYRRGEGVQKNVERGARFFEKAAMLGNAEARHNLGCYECNRGDYDRAVRHFLISAKMGDKDSLEEIKEFFKKGYATKEQYAEALKGYQGAVDEVKSRDRDEAKAFLDDTERMMKRRG